MQTTLALAALVAVASAQVTSLITPSTSEPAGFSESYSGTFEITAVAAATEKRDLSKRTCGAVGSLTLTLEDGVLKDTKGRTGYIASNYQFQFDGPPQDGAIYTGGFSIGTNASLALGGSTVFYECLSGSFYNLYDRSWAPQCTEIHIVALPCGTTTTTSSSSSATATDSSSTATTQIAISETDGQAQVPTSLVSQIATETSAISTTIAISSSDSGATTTGSISSSTESSASSSITSKASVTTSVKTTSSVSGSTTSTSAVAAGASSVAVGSSFAAAVVGFAAMLLL